MVLLTPCSQRHTRHPRSRVTNSQVRNDPMVRDPRPVAHDSRFHGARPSLQASGACYATATPSGPWRHAHTHGPLRDSRLLLSPSPKSSSISDSQAQIYLCLRFTSYTYTWHPSPLLLDLQLFQRFYIK